MMPRTSALPILIASAALMWSALAHSEIAVVVHPENPAASMTAEQVAAIYLGKNSRLRPVDLPDSAALYHWFYYKVTGRDAVQISIARAKLIATPPPKIAPDSTVAVRYVAANKRAIAYVDRRAVDASVKVVMTIQNPALLDRVARD